MSVSFVDAVSPSNKLVKGHDFDRVTSVAPYGRTMLHYIALHDLVEWAQPPLRSMCGDRDDNGETPLFFSSSGGMTAALVERLGADASVQNDCGRSPIHVAAMNGKCGCILALSSHVHDRTRDGESALLLSLQFRQFDAASVLLDLGARDADALDYAIAEQLEGPLLRMIRAGFPLCADAVDRISLTETLAEALIEHSSFSSARILSFVASLQRSVSLFRSLLLFRHERFAIVSAFKHAATSPSAQLLLLRMDLDAKRECLIWAIRSRRTERLRDLLPHFDCIDLVSDSCGCTCEYLSRPCPSVRALVATKLSSSVHSDPHCSLWHFCR